MHIDGNTNDYIISNIDASSKNVERIDSNPATSKNDTFNITFENGNNFNLINEEVKVKNEDYQYLK